MPYLAEEITFDSDGLAEFGPMMTEDDIKEGELTFHEYQTLRRAVMMVGLTKSREEIAAYCQDNPNASFDLMEMAISAYEQHQLALEFLKTALARIVTGSAIAESSQALSREQKEIVEQAIDLAFSSRMV